MAARRCSRHCNRRLLQVTPWNTRMSRQLHAIWRSFRRSMRPAALSTPLPQPRRRSRRCRADAATAAGTVAAAPASVGAARPARRASSAPAPAAARSPACAAVNACGDGLVLCRAAGCRWRRPGGRRASPGAPRSAGSRACLTRSSATDCGDWRHFRSGLRRSVPEARARRVDQHAVDLAGQPLDAVVALVGDLRRMHVRQPAAREPRLERVEPVGRGVEGVEPAGVAHRRAERQRLAAGAGAEVDHHLAALGVEQQRQQLAALVLHLDVAAREDIELVQRRLAVDAQAPAANTASARPRCRPAASSRLHVVALGLERVDAQVERRRLRSGSRPAARTRRRAASCSGSASHSGRLWRSRSEQRRCGRPRRRCSSQSRSVSLERARAGSRRCPASRGSPGGARSRPCPTAPGAGTAGAGAAPRRWSRPARGARALPSARCSRKKRRRRHRPGARSAAPGAAVRCACSSRAFGCIARIILGPIAEGALEHAAPRDAMKRIAQPPAGAPAPDPRRRSSAPRPPCRRAARRRTRHRAALIGWNVGVWSTCVLIGLMMLARRPRPPATRRAGAGRGRGRGADDRRRRRRSQPRRRSCSSWRRPRRPAPRARAGAPAAGARHRDRLVAAAADAVRAQLREPVLRPRRSGGGLHFPGADADVRARLRRLPLLLVHDRGGLRRPPTSASRRRRCAD